MDKPINTIWMITREYDGLAGNGGVKDMSRQLAEALARAGSKVTVVMPRYGFMDPVQLGLARLDCTFAVDMNYVGVERREEVGIWSMESGGVTIFLIEADRYAEKKGIYTYTAEEETQNPFNRRGTGYYDYFAMNVLLQKAAIDLILTLKARPEVIHCQDAHTAILPAMISEVEGIRHYFRETGTVVTIHNAGHGYHQEVGDLPFARAICGLSAGFIRQHLLDGQFNPFLAASPYALLNTVSENYARELQETEDDAMSGWLGHRLLARGVIIEGITNGINPGAFSVPGPAGSVEAAAAKQAAKQALLSDLANQRVSGVEQIGTLAELPAQPLFTMIGRLMPQKGVDVMAAAMKQLLGIDQDFAVLIQGTGSPEMEGMVAALARDEAWRGRICYLRGYDPQLAARIYAAGDFFLVPSEYEPCGLTDFIAQLHGNLPVVHHVGGLVKVEDGVTGFSYHQHSPEALIGAMQRAMRLFRQEPEILAAMQAAAVRRINEQYTWDIVVKRYLLLYQAAAAFAQSQERQHLRAAGQARQVLAN